MPWRRAWLSTLVPLPGESYGQRILAGYSPWGSQRVKTWQLLNTYTHTRNLDRQWVAYPFAFFLLWFKRISRTYDAPYGMSWSHLLTSPTPPCSLPTMLYTLAWFQFLKTLEVLSWLGLCTCWALHPKCCSFTSFLAGCFSVFRFQSKSHFPRFSLWLRIHLPMQTTKL